MTLKRLSIAVLAGSALLAAAPVLAHGDDDDWEEHRRHQHKKKPKRELRHHQYYYQPPVVIYRNAPPASPVYRDSPAPSAETPAGKADPRFPTESVTERSLARERQREILEKELATEQQLLAEAKKQLTEQEAARPGDERAYARLQPYKDSVELHARNIEALRREMMILNR